MTIFGTIEIFAAAIPFWLASGALVYLCVFLLQSHIRNFVVAIDNDQISYYEFSRQGGKQKKLRQMPTSEVDRITYSYWSQNRGIGRFNIHPREGSSFEKIDFIMEGVSPAEALHIELWLQLKLDEIAKVIAK